MHYLQQLTLQHSNKLLFVFFCLFVFLFFEVDLSVFSNGSDHHMKDPRQATS